MVHYGVFFTLFLAAIALAHDSQGGPSSSNPPATISSSQPVPSYITIFKTKTKTEFKYKTVTKTNTVESCSTPGNPNPGKPTSVAKPDDKPTTTPPLLSTHTLPPNSIKPPTSPTPSPTPTSGYPNNNGNDDDNEDCEDDGDGDDDDNDEDCEDDGEDDGVSSNLPASSSVKPEPSSGYPSKSSITPPATLIAVPSSSPVPPSSPSPSPVPSSSMASPPASSVTPSTGAPKPTSTGKYDRNAICGNQKREPNLLEAAPQLSKRDLRHRNTY